MTLKTKLLIITVVLVVAGYFTWQTETFQKAAFPVKYWTNEIKSLERVIKFNEGMIFSANISLKKIDLTAELEIADAAYSAESIGLTKQQAVEFEINNIKEEIKHYNNIIEQITEMNKNFNKKLTQATIELSKYQ